MKLLNSNRPKESYNIVYEGRVIGRCEDITWNPITTPFEVVLKTGAVNLTISNTIAKPYDAIPFDLTHTVKDGYSIFKKCFIKNIKNAILNNKNEITFETMTVQYHSVSFYLLSEIL